MSLESRLTDLKVTGDSATGIVKGVVDSSGGIIPKLNDILTGQAHMPLAAAQKITDASGAAFSDGAKWAALSAAVFLLLGLFSTFRLSSKQHGEGSHHE